MHLKVRLAAWAVLLFSTAISAHASDPTQNWVEVRSPHFRVVTNAGEREGRRVAAQFEQMRRLFEKAFRNVRVDFGKPTIIFALKNENSLKMFMPGYGLNKNATHLAGMYHPTPDMNFAMIRTDATGSGVNPYHALYHEYTHAILRLNFRGLPLWLEEGLAEFYGNTTFERNQATYGSIDRNQLRTLQQGRLIPISTLVTADQSSPLYNRQEHAGLFYSESWALVHFFSVAPGVRDQQLINKFLSTLDETDDPVEAANQTFGDLTRLGQRLEEYARQLEFVAIRLPLEADGEEKGFRARRLEPAEVLVEQANYLARSGYREQAVNALDQALAQNPKLPAIHESLGYCHYVESAFDDAAKEFDRAIALDPSDALAFFYKANILLRRRGEGNDSIREIQKDLEKAIALKPDFAPAHAFLSMAYSKSAATKPKAIQEAERATQLEPGNLAYLLDLGKALMANGRTEDARHVAEVAGKVATTSRDRALASSFGREVNRQASGSPVESAPNQQASLKSSSGEAKADNGKLETMTIDGQIQELNCSHAPEVMLTLRGTGSETLLHAEDISKVEQLVNGAAQATGLACAQWKDRRVKVRFAAPSGRTGQGELQAVDFEGGDTEAGQ
ncbi:MAG: tetratricopeptide repeat protein [Acidobacteria bacterium]|nr:tetratricopeptide repeat protein [Acidobacteriota bacterium]